MRLQGVSVYLIACLAVFIIGCTRPYNPPVIDEPPLAYAESFPGIKDFLQTDKPLRIFWTHGMCSHNFRWAENRSAVLQGILGIPVEPPREDKDRGSTDPYVVPQNFVTPNGKVDAFFFIWSPMTDAYKDALFFDSPIGKSLLSRGEFPFKRASGNNLLKVDLMNDCLVDAVAYLGTNGDPIRRAMQSALCTALGGQMESPPHCDLTDKREIGPLLLVTESLGSKFLFDAVRAIWTAAGSRSPAAQTRLAAHLAEVQMLYMIANQVPLLDQAAPVDKPPAAGAAADARPAGKSMADFIRILSNARRSAPAAALSAQPSGPLKPLTVVAFTDPNDVLSYRLLPSVLGVAEARLVNVIVSNSTTYLGLIERPDTAHRGYADNPYVIGLLAEGYDGGDVIPAWRVCDGRACLE